MSEVKILLCDDDPDLLALLVRRLKKMGIEPDLANDGRQAKGFVEENNYDVIIADIYMPEATGLEVMQQAKQKDADTQVVIITSSATLDNAIDSLNHGAFGYLTKPFDHLIVFDNMISRALEYRQLLVANKRKAEAQKRRGDMLEDEVAQRVVQLQKKQKGLLDLLGSLPDGILVVTEDGKVALSSPVGERWLAQDQKSEKRPIQAFVSQVHSKTAQPNAEVRLNDRDLQLTAVDFPDDGDIKRKAVIIREVEENGLGAGSMVTETVLGIKKGLATLYEQGVGTEVVLDIASQFAVLEKMAGWTPGSGGPAQSEGPDNAPIPEPNAGASTEPAPASEADVSGENPPENFQAADADPTQAPSEPSSAPPFAIPRERVPTAELDGPRLNTSELQDALRASAPEPEAPAEAAADPPADSPQDLAPQPEVPDSGPENVAPDPEQAHSVVSSESVIEPEQTTQTPVTHREPAAAKTPPEDVAKPEPAADDSAAEPLEVPVDPELESPSAPPVESEAADAPSWIDGIEGIDEADTLPELADQQSGPEFPESQTGDLPDTSMFRPRVIPEEMDAKLETPVEVPSSNGDEEFPRHVHDGPITIQAKSADTQTFRKVLKGLSGTEVLSADYEHSEGGPPPDKPAAQRRHVPENPEPKPEPSPDELRKLAEPEPDPGPAPASWPPSLPTDEEDWDDSLDTSG